MIVYTIPQPSISLVLLLCHGLHENCEHYLITIQHHPEAGTQRGDQCNYLLTLPSVQDGATLFPVLFLKCKHSILQRSISITSSCWKHKVEYTPIKYNIHSNLSKSEWGKRPQQLHRVSSNQFPLEQNMHLPGSMQRPSERYILSYPMSSSSCSICIIP